MVVTEIQLKPVSQLIVALLFGACVALEAHAQTPAVNSIVIENAWARATPAGAKTGAVYMTLINNGAIPDRLLSATTPVADHVQIHKVSEENGVSSMRELRTMDIAPGATVTFKPSDMHVMLVGLKQPLEEGQTVPLTLEFEKIGKVNLLAAVAKVGAMRGGNVGSMNHGHDGPMKK